MDSNRIREVVETLDNCLSAEYVPNHMNVYMTRKQAEAVREVLDTECSYFIRNVFRFITKTGKYGRRR